MLSQKTRLAEIMMDTTKNALEKNGFEVLLVDSKEEALTALKNLIDMDSTIGTGGSTTLEEIGFFEHFSQENYPNYLDRNRSGLTPEETFDIQRNSLVADYFVCSANSVSSDGRLFFIDYTGNRNAGATYGPKKRVFVVGRNKLVSQKQGGLNRASNTAAVLNNIRFGMPNPCTSKGYCVNCNSDTTLCRITTTLSRCEPPKSALVILVNEELGF